MPTKSTTRKARKELREGYAPTTAAGEFVREEMHHKERGRHGPESRRQAIAIGLSKARRAGIPIRRAPKGRRRPAPRASARRGARRTARTARKVR